MDRICSNVQTIKQLNKKNKFQLDTNRLTKNGSRTKQDKNNVCTAGYWPDADSIGDKLVDYIDNCVRIGMLTVLDAGNVDGAVGCDGERFSVQTMVYWFFYLLWNMNRHYCSSWAVAVGRLLPGHHVRSQYRKQTVTAKYSHRYGNILKIHPT